MKATHTAHRGRERIHTGRYPPHPCGNVADPSTEEHIRVWEQLGLLDQSGLPTVIFITYKLRHTFTHSSWDSESNRQPNRWRKTPKRSLFRHQNDREHMKATSKLALKCASVNRIDEIHNSEMVDVGVGRLFDEATVPSSQPAASLRTAHWVFPKNGTTATTFAVFAEKRH